MVLLFKQPSLLARRPRRRKTCYFLMLHPFPLVSRCKVMYSGLSSHETHLFQPTNHACSLLLRTTRRPSRSLCTFLSDSVFFAVYLISVSATKESGPSAVTIVCLVNSS